MSDERMARPVSGEIMTDGQRSGERAGAPRSDTHDIIDADYETILPGGKTAPRDRETAAAPQERAGMDMLRQAGAAEHPKRRSGGPLFWTVGLAVVAGAFWVSGGHAIVSQNNEAEKAATAAAPYKQPLRIVDVVSRIDRRAGRAFLLVDGEVANQSPAGAVVPPLAIIVTGLDGRETRYFLGTNDKVLAPGGRFAFSSRLHAPNEGVATVTVDFRKDTDS